MAKEMGKFKIPQISNGAMNKLSWIKTKISLKRESSKILWLKLGYCMLSAHKSKIDHETTKLWHSVHHPFCRGWGGGRVSDQIFKKGGLTGSQFLEWRCWEREGDFFLGGGGGGGGWGGGGGGGAWQKRGMVVFLKGAWYPNAYYVWDLSSKKKHQGITFYTLANMKKRGRCYLKQ